MGPEDGAGDVHRVQGGWRVDRLVVVLDPSGEHVEQRGQRFGNVGIERERVDARADRRPLARGRAERVTVVKWGRLVERVRRSIRRRGPQFVPGHRAATRLVAADIGVAPPPRPPRQLPAGPAQHVSCGPQQLGRIPRSCCRFGLFAHRRLPPSCPTPPLCMEVPPFASDQDRRTRRGSALPGAGGEQLAACLHDCRETPPRAEAQGPRSKPEGPPSNSGRDVTVLRGLAPDVAAQEQLVAVLTLAELAVAGARGGGNSDGDRRAGLRVAQLGVGGQVTDDGDDGLVGQDRRDR